jgi:hypothetical protein
VLADSAGSTLGDGAWLASSSGPEGSGGQGTVRKRPGVRRLGAHVVHVSLSGEAAPVTDCSWSFRARGHVSFA